MRGSGVRSTAKVGGGAVVQGVGGTSEVGIIVEVEVVEVGKVEVGKVEVGKVEVVEVVEVEVEVVEVEVVGIAVDQLVDTGPIPAGLMADTWKS